MTHTQTITEIIAEGLDQSGPGGIGFGEEHLAAVRLANAAPDLLRALQIISNFTKCQCAAKHGDNPNCAVWIAEAAIAKATKGEVAPC